MNKLALKTFTYSILALLSAVLFFLGSMVIFFPKVTSNGCATLGLDDLSAKCSEIVYKRDDSFENLLDLVAKSVYSDNETLIIRYSGKLLDEPRFYDYSESRYTDSGTKYYDFIANKYSTALYRKGDKQKAFDTVFKYTFEFGNYNPVNSFIICAYKNKDKATLENIYTKLEPLTIDKTITKEELKRIREETPSVTLVERAVTDEEQAAISDVLLKIREMISRIEQAQKSA